MTLWPWPHGHGNFARMVEPREIPAGKFKNGCLALLDEVAATGETIIVTKRGRPVAKVVPVEAPAPLLGSVSYATEADLVAPLPQQWDAET